MTESPSEVDVDAVDKSALIEELSTYLTDSRQRLSQGRLNGEDEPLLVYPPDFDTIANAMSREDLESSEKDWSYYLFAKKFKIDSDGSLEHGRYQSLFREGYAIEELTAGSSEDSKVTMGLAEIALLDRQLRAALRRAKNISEPADSDAGREDRTFITNLEPAQRLQDVVFSIPQLPTNSDEIRLALLLKSEKSDAERNPSEGRRGYLGFLSDNEATRLKEIDRRLEAYGHVPLDQATDPPPDIISEEEAPVLARLQRVRDEYSKALDIAMSRVRGDRGRFVPYLQPIALKEDDLVYLARHERPVRSTGKPEEPETSSLLERVR